MERDNKIKTIKDKINDCYKVKCDTSGLYINRSEAYIEAVYQEIMALLLEDYFIDTVCSIEEIDYMLSLNDIVEDMVEKFMKFEDVDICSRESLTIFLDIYFKYCLQ